MAASASVGFIPGTLVAPNWTKVTANEMNVFLTGLDNTMNRIADHVSSGIFMQDLFINPDEKDITLLRQCLRSLLLVGNFGDLSVQAQVHPGMQERIKYSEAEMNEALSGVTDMLKSLTPEDMHHIKSVVKEDPDLPEKILEALDLEAQYVEVPQRRRRQLRAMQRRIIKRLKHSPDVLVDEYLKKIEKMENYADSEEQLQKMLIKQMGKEKYEETLKEAEIAFEEWNNMNVDDTPIGYKNLHLDQPKQKREKDPRFRGGKRLLGIGAITTASGWLLIAIAGSAEALLWIGVVAGVTIGPILILIALFILLAKAIQKSSEKKQNLKE